MRGGVGGRGLRGGLGAVDSAEDTGQEWASHRIAAHALTRQGEAIFPVGSGFATANAAPPQPGALSLVWTPSSVTNGANRLIALPEVFPRNARITRLVQILTASGTAPAGATLEFGVYSSVAEGSPWPATRMWTSGTIDLNSVGPTPTVAEFKPPGGLYIAAGSLVWFCSVFSAEAGQPNPDECTALLSGDRNWPAILGYVFEDSGSYFAGPASTYAGPKGHFGWSIPLGASTLPTTAPTPDPIAHRLTNQNNWFWPCPFYSQIPA